MGVYIKNWKMPECCGACSLCYSHCAITGSKVGDDTVSEKRLDDCPLYDVPPHGRLIDADEMRDEWLINGENDYIYDTNSFLDSIDNAPTIIEAEWKNNGTA